MTRKNIQTSRIISNTPRTPKRRCVGCGMSFEKKELIRVDVNHRGAYLCRSEACLKKASKRKSVSQSLYEQLEKEYVFELSRQ